MTISRNFCLAGTRRGRGFRLPLPPSREGQGRVFFFSIVLPSFSLYDLRMYPVRRQISPHAARLRCERTDVENSVWQALRNRQCAGFKFRFQATIGRFVVDFCCVEARLIVELDGGQHSAATDAVRTRFSGGAWISRASVLEYRRRRESGRRVGGNSPRACGSCRRKEEAPHPTLSRECGRGLRN